MAQHTGIKGPSEMDLLQGQAYFGQLPGGTVLQVAAGSVRLVQHVAMDQAHLSLRTTIARGGVHWLQATAWVEVQALENAQLLIHAPAAVTVTELLRNGLVAGLTVVYKFLRLLRLPVPH